MVKSQAPSHPQRQIDIHRRPWAYGVTRERRWELAERWRVEKERERVGEGKGRGRLVVKFAGLGQGVLDLA